MEIVVTFPEGSMRCGYTGEKERCRTEFFWDVGDGEEKMFENCVPDSVL